MTDLWIWLKLSTLIELIKQAVSINHHIFMFMVLKANISPCSLHLIITMLSMAAKHWKKHTTVTCLQRSHLPSRASHMTLKEMDTNLSFTSTSEGTYRPPLRENQNSVNSVHWYRGWEFDKPTLRINAGGRNEIKKLRKCCIKIILAIYKLGPSPGASRAWATLRGVLLGVWTGEVGA